VPCYKNGYTVNKFLKDEFERRYNVKYEIVRNLPTKEMSSQTVDYTANPKPIIIYQGAINYGRGFDQLIVAMHQVDALLHIYGIGNYYNQVVSLIRTNKLEHKIKLFGATLPIDLKKITPLAQFGITIFEPKGLNQYYSLANRFLTT